MADEGTTTFEATISKLGDEIAELTLKQAVDLADYMKETYSIEPAAGGAIMMAPGGADAAVVGVAAGAPMRGFQVEDLLLVQRGGGRWWLGLRTASRSGAWTTIQPLIGPLWPSGLQFTFRDAAGAATTTRDEVVSVDLTLRGESQRSVRYGTGAPVYLRDSLSTHIALRNNPRF